MLKVIYNGEHLCNIYPHATKWQVIKYKTAKVIRGTIIGLSAVAVIIGAYKSGAYLEPRTVQGETQIQEVVKTLQFEDIPILMKICQAESGSRQFKKNGDVIRGTINPSDIGFCQINEVINNDEARKLGFDIYTEKGNKDYAVYLFLHRGTAPWNSSKEIWNK